MRILRIVRNKFAMYCPAHPTLLTNFNSFDILITDWMSPFQNSSAPKVMAKKTSHLLPEAGYTIKNICWHFQRNMLLFVRDRIAIPPLAQVALLASNRFSVSFYWTENAAFGRRFLLKYYRYSCVEELKANRYASHTRFLLIRNGLHMKVCPCFTLGRLRIDVWTQWVLCLTHTQASWNEEKLSQLQVA